MNRRTFLTCGLCLGVGAGGYAAYSEGMIPDGMAATIAESTGPPSTETEIAEHEFSDAEFGAPPFDSVTLYESGAAEVFFNYDHETERFGFAHESLSVLDSAFRIWDSPQYEGPTVIDLRSVIQNHVPYPSNQFKLGVYFEEAENVYVGTRTARFALPEPWYAAVQDD